MKKFSNSKSKSSDLDTNINNKMQVIPEQMKGLQFSTTDLRQKFIHGHTNVSNPIITWVTTVNTTQQVKVDIYPHPIKQVKDPGICL